MKNLSTTSVLTLADALCNQVLELGKVDFKAMFFELNAVEDELDERFNSDEITIKEFREIHYTLIRLQKAKDKCLQIKWK